MGIANLHLLILLSLVTVAELAVNEAPSEWNGGEWVETRKARLSSKASSAALASDYHNGRGTRDDRGPRRRRRRTQRICSQSQWEKEWERQTGWLATSPRATVGRRVRTARTKAADKKSWKVPLLLPGQLLSPARFAICISSSRLNLQRKNQRLAETLSCVSGWAQVFSESVGRRPSSESALGSDGPQRDLPLPRESIAKVARSRSSSDNCFSKVKPLSLQGQRT